MKHIEIMLCMAGAALFGKQAFADDFDAIRCKSGWGEIYTRDGPALYCKDDGIPTGGITPPSQNTSTVVIGTLGPIAANYGTWRAEYIGTTTKTGKYASPLIMIYSNTKNSLRCTGKISLEDAAGNTINPVFATKNIAPFSNGTLVSASTGTARWAPSFLVQCENVDDYPSGGTANSSSGTTTIDTNSTGVAASSPIPGPSYQVGQGLVQPGITIVPSSNPSSSGNSAGSSAPNCIYTDGCYFGLFGKVSTDSGPADGLVKKIHFTIEQVSNTTDLPSGDIRLEVWAMMQDGKNGYLLGQRNISPLEPGYFRQSSVDADVTLMPSGNYRVVLVARSAIGSDALQMDGLLVSYGPNGAGNSLKTTQADQQGAVPNASISATDMANGGATGNSAGAPTGSTNPNSGTPPTSNNTSSTGTSAPASINTSTGSGGGDGGGGGGCSIGSSSPFDPSLWLLALGAAAAIASRKRPLAACRT